MEITKSGSESDHSDVNGLDETGSVEKASGEGCGETSEIRDDKERQWRL